MSNTTQNLDLATLAGRTGLAVANLAKNDTVFRAAVDAFRAGDGDSFTRLLEQVDALPYCEEICRWFASKECVLECLELCGPATVEITAEQVAAAAVEIARISRDEELVERLADVVERRDVAGYRAFIASHKLEACIANATGITTKAQPNIAVLRARLSETPRFSSRDELQPPSTEPISAIT